MEQYIPYTLIRDLFSRNLETYLQAGVEYSISVVDRDSDVITLSIRLFTLETTPIQKSWKWNICVYLFHEI